jgi:hypothetical protein
MVDRDHSPNSCHIKAELVEKAGLMDIVGQEQISHIRRKYGIKKTSNGLANLFESGWNNIMFKVKKATFIVPMVNQLFSTEYQTVSDPIVLLQRRPLSFTMRPPKPPTSFPRNMDDARGAIYPRAYSFISLPSG